MEGERLASVINQAGVWYIGSAHSAEPAAGRAAWIAWMSVSANPGRVKHLSAGRGCDRRRATRSKGKASMSVTPAVKAILD